MTETQHLTLFVVFVAFFVVIGIIALLAIIGVVSTDKEFHRWSVAGVAAAVVGVLVIWTKSSPPAPPVDFLVNLRPPEGVASTTFELVSGHWEDNEPSPSAKPTEHSGAIILTA